MELGGVGWPESGGGMGELGRLEVRDGTDSWGPLDRETRERWQARKARNKRENVFPQRRHRRTGWMGQRGGGFGLWGQRGQWAG
jgi:hypothetical protein